MSQAHHQGYTSTATNNGGGGSSSSRGGDHHQHHHSTNRGPGPGAGAAGLPGGLPTGKTHQKDNFSPSLESIDSQAPVSPNHGTTWDTETDHLLSFFLGGDAHHLSGNAMPNFHSSTIRVPPPSGTTIEHTNNGSFSGESKKPDQHHLMMQEEDDEEEDTEDDGAPPPPTPAMTFYAPPSHSRSSSHNNGHHAHPNMGSISALPGTALTSSSSSSSLSSGAQAAAAAAALASGGSIFQNIQQQHQQFMQQQQQQQQQQVQGQPHNPPSGPAPMQRNSPVDHSPISPAALIGHGHENLMLPPPARQRAAAAAAAAAAGGTTSTNNAGSVDPTAMTTTATATTADASAPIPDPNSVQPGGAATDSMSEQERHLAWLRDLNAFAKAATSGGSAMLAPVAPQGGGGGVPNAAVGSIAQQQPPGASAGVGSFPGPLAPNPMMYPHGGPAAAAMMMQLHPHHAAAASSKPPVESAEKRAKRLERNRESARKSRRRKKERLATLEAQVNKLHGEIETERGRQVNAMVPALRRLRQNASLANLPDIIRWTGSNSEIARAVLDFQHTGLKQVVLPRYHKILLWFTLQDESFFFAGKEKYAASNGESSGGGGGKGPRPSTKISSKQIGEELTSGPKNEKGKSKSKRRVTFKDGEEGSRPNLTPYANDAARVWPLFCYEMSFSVDQEERFVATHKQLQEVGSLANSRSQMADAVLTGDSLGEAVESLSRVVALREERTLNGILAPAQLATYQNWLGSNRERCNNILPPDIGAIDKTTTSLATESSSLPEICRRLHEVLQISQSPEKY